MIMTTYHDFRSLRWAIRPVCPTKSRDITSSGWAQTGSGGRRGGFGSGAPWPQRPDRHDHDVLVEGAVLIGWQLMSRMRVLAAMSGGVDSAVAAARAADAGHEVTGVHLALSLNPQSYRSGARGCCTLEDARDARRAADVIGIPFYVWDMAERFHQDVVTDFVA